MILHVWKVHLSSNTRSLLSKENINEENLIKEERIA